MKLSLRILLGYFLVVGLTGVFALIIVVREVKPSVRETIEETMVDAANLLAALAAADMQAGRLADGAFATQVRAYAQRHVDAPIWHFHKTSLDFRIYVTDAAGRVVFDSDGRAVGDDYSRWNDVRRTLLGQYGARSTQSEPGKDASSVFHVAAPVLDDGGRIIGSLTVAKPIASVDPIIGRAERSITRYGLLLVAASLAVGLFMTVRLSASVGRLQRYAREVSEGRPAEVPESGARELNDLAQAMALMREKLEGKHYVERYVQALAHELKSPLAGVRGAAELLAEEDLPAGPRMQFARNVREQSLRMQGLLDRMLQLSRLEASAAPERHAFDPCAAVRAACEERTALAHSRRVTIKRPAADSAPALEGDAGLFELAVGSLLDNAIDFAPADTVVSVDLDITPDAVVLAVRDHGPGIPDYALGRVFERFYSLARPQGGRGSGIGLSLVKEIAQLHGGRIDLGNHADGGVLATLTLPRNR